MNVTITMKETIYQKSNWRAGGNSISAKVTTENGIEMNEFRRNAVYIDVMELGLVKVVEHIRGNEYEPADVTVTDAPGYTLNAGMKAYLTDKYALQSEINSITFA